MDIPRVDIVIPVYNGAPHLGECLESVLAQRYGNWKAIVVDNCSSDETGRIADAYAQRDARLAVVHCTEFLGQADNYNRAITHASPSAEYIKVLEADNTITADSLEKMVEVAETDPRIGIVGCYCVMGKQILGGGVDYATRVLSGKDVWREMFVDNHYIFGTPTSLLFRARALLGTTPWFRASLFYDDVDICMRMLREWKFGYVHQVLAFIRTDNAGIFSRFQEYDFKPAYMHFVAQDYGQDFDEGQSLARVRSRWQREYYGRLAHAVFSGRGRSYWEFNTGAFRARGEKLSRAMLLRCVALEFLDVVLNPKSTLERLLRKASAGSPAA